MTVDPAHLEAIGQLRARVDARLAVLVPDPDREPRRVHAAMAYALTGPGKRLRPILTLLVARLFGATIADNDALIDLACALEMVHASSLVLDDMPMMDDAALRRGRVTTHRIYGDDVAVLAAFALLNEAYAIIAARATRLALERYTPEDLVHLMTQAVGCDGLIGGQALDLEGRQASIDLGRLEFIHSRKTGALFIAAAELGAMVADARRRGLGAITRYAKNLGLAFQITDDLLDVDGDSAETGKDAGQDADKHTFVGLLGADGARALNHELLDFALDSLMPLGRRADPLRALVATVRERRR